MSTTIDQDADYVNVTFRVPLPLKRKLDDLAAADQRTLSNYIRVVLDRHITAIEAGQPEPLKETA